MDHADVCDDTQLRFHESRTSPVFVNRTSACCVCGLSINIVNSVTGIETRALESHDPSEGSVIMPSGKQ